MFRRVIFSIFFIFLIGCGADENKEQISEIKADEKSELIDKNAPIELELWSYYSGGWEYAIDQFEQSHPGVTVKVQFFTFEEYQKEYLKALATKETPDLMVFDSNHFGHFMALDGLEDLAKEPYTLEHYREHFSESLWNMGQSFDGKKMIGVPIGPSPLVTFYRADIMEEYGFPSDPEELGDYMEDPNNWIKMATELREDDKWMIQDAMEPIQIYKSTRGVFNQELELVRTGEDFKKAIDLARVIRENDLVAPINVWEKNGVEVLKNDQFVMFYRGNWGSGEISGWVPEQSGKWRATRLPFNQFGWSNAPIISIPNASKQKELAWEFVESYSFGESYGVFNRSTDLRKNEFLGGQQDMVLFEEIMKKVEVPNLTPIDEKADAIWNSTLWNNWDTKLSTEQIMDEITKSINEQLSKEKEYLLRD
ncbi:ABC transporter substrate-binding protein [Litchfieldia salsa]|uniref:Multiple sugar transport system substrate-binding protein n=1 Tax=Litchfieldia salsa TaxID=930152 RepID=A0A1H0W5A1_9BACI|nr:extracellular solute-binding protein [Litchfieldia salsa]SDP85927.1 multiple sugar transport system substrate-binding protein [Litchfieldia salsa]